jgi:folate-binding protein YgfZ
MDNPFTELERAAGAAESLWIDLPRSRAAVACEAFDRHIIADDVQVTDQSHRFARLLVVGSRAGDVVSAALGVDTDRLAPWHHADTRLEDVSVRIVAAGWFGLPGFDVIVPVEQAARLWDAVSGAGRGFGASPVGMAALEVLRVEAAWPWFGVDFDESHLLMEALTAEHVSFTKGCYIGQEVVIRVEHQGRLNKRLCGLRMRGDRVPPRGASIVCEGRSVGSITSAAHSPALGGPIALGYVRRECWEPGTLVSIAAPDGPLEAEVVPLPFVPAAQSPDL